ncbi:MAG: 2-phospho-L-lactate transferase, partial [Chloroflexi bacterium]|nr:2-phospho-L-lactate transferase [Chloroflexota bacterium]
MAARHVTVLAGGYGGAKLSHGIALASAAAVRAGRATIELSIVANTGDDLELHGLSVSPDLDTLLYTLAGLANEQTGWGVRDETWSSAAMLARLGAPTWFQLGDRDLGLNLWRTARLREGQRLTDVTAGLVTAMGVAARLLPATDSAVRTELLTEDGWLEFQEYFVHRHHAVPVTALRYRGAETAEPTAEVLKAIATADLLVIAPSNPFLSIGTILALPGITDALRSAPATVVAVSPIVGGVALRGPADRLFESLGGAASALGVARHYQEHAPGLVDALVIDTQDADAAAAIAGLGLEVMVTGTVMRDHA